MLSLCCYISSSQKCCVWKPPNASPPASQERHNKLPRNSQQYDRHVRSLKFLWRRVVGPSNEQVKNGYRLECQKIKSFRHKNFGQIQEGKTLVAEWFIFPVDFLHKTYENTWKPYVLSCVLYLFRSSNGFNPPWGFLAISEHHEVRFHWNLAEIDPRIFSQLCLEVWEGDLSRKAKTHLQLHPLSGRIIVGEFLLPPPV